MTTKTKIKCGNPACAACAVAPGSCGCVAKWNPKAGIPMTREQGLAAGRALIAEKAALAANLEHIATRGPTPKHTAQALATNYGGDRLVLLHVAGDAADTMERLANRASDAEQRRTRRKRKLKTEKQVWLIPCRREELEPLRAFLRETVPGDGPKRHDHRMAWAEVLRGSAFRDRDTSWLVAASHGNAEDAEKLVANTRQRHEAGQRNRGKGYLETELGTATMARYTELLGRIKVKGTPKRVKPKKGATPATGDLRRRVRGFSALGKPARDAMVAHAALLRSLDPEDPAINALLRPGICRSIHERVTCQGCNGSRGTRRIACEDELCAWCHGSRVIHEHDLALANWQAAGVGDILGLEVWGFHTLAEQSEWIRHRSLARLGLKMLKVKTHRYLEPSLEAKAEAIAAGAFEPEGKIEHGVLLLIPFTGWRQACLHGARIQQSGATLTRYTAAGAAERAAELRWGTHVAFRTAAVFGEVAELSRVLRDQFRRQAASGGKEALFWPGRTEARQSICAEVRARREAESANGSGCSSHDGRHECPCDPRTVPAYYDLMSSGREDAVAVHRQEHPHALVRAWAFLEHHRAELRQLAEHLAREQARELAAVPF